MTEPWTDDETAALANYGGHFSDVPAHFGVRAAAELERRGAAIERLEARVAELEAPAGYAGLGSHASDLRELRACQERIATLEAALANSIPRGELVRALKAAVRVSYEGAFLPRKLIEAIESRTFPPKEG